MREGGGWLGRASSLSPLSLGEQPARTDRRTDGHRALPAVLGGAGTGHRRPARTPSRRAPPRPVGADGSSRGSQPRWRRVERRGPATQPGDSRALPEPRGVPAVRLAGSGSEWERPPSPPPPPPSVETRCCPGSGACCKVGTSACGKAESIQPRQAGRPLRQGARVGQ